MNSEKTIHIRPYKSLYDSFDPKKLWSFKDLLVALTVRDIKMRHKQTVLGVAWVIFQPLLSTVIFTLIFGYLIKIPSSDLPYPLFIFIGLLFWNLFSGSVTAISGSLIGNEVLIKKVFFPRMILPLSVMVTCLFDFVISIVFMIFFVLYYHMVPNPWIILYFPISLFITLSTILGLGSFLAAANAKYRDVRLILPFFIQILLFVTPVIYPTSIVSDSRRWILSINPLSSVIEMNRVLLSGHAYIPTIELLISLISASLILMFGVYYFSKLEKSFADVI